MTEIISGTDSTRSPHARAHHAIRRMHRALLIAGTAAPLAPLPAVAVPEPPPNNKKKRGPRFKYVYDCPEAAAEARRARNRATALRSYRQKRQHTADMEAMVSRLEKERGVLLKLLRAVEDGTVAGIGDDRDIDWWVRDNEGGADASVPVPHGASR